MDLFAYTHTHEDYQISRLHDTAPYHHNMRIIRKADYTILLLIISTRGLSDKQITRYCSSSSQHDRRHNVLVFSDVSL